MFLGREARTWRRSTRRLREKTRSVWCPCGMLRNTRGQNQPDSGCPNPQPSEGLPGSHSTQGGRRAPEAVLASSASAGLSSVKRVAAQTKERQKTRRGEGEKKGNKNQTEEPQLQPISRKNGGLRYQSSPEINEKGVSKGNPLNR